MWPFSRRPAQAAHPVAVRTVDVRQAFARSKRGAKLIDVRSSREFRLAGRPKGAISVPPQLIKKDRTGLERDDEILVICLSGHRSPRQARKLAEMGFAKVTNVEGGLRAWTKAGLPVKR
jgi:rhodanese-related sulfurtransferase